MTALPQVDRTSYINNQQITSTDNTQCQCSEIVKERPRQQISPWIKVKLQK